MIYISQDYKKNYRDFRDKEIYFCNYAIVDLLPDDVWKVVAEDSIEYALISKLDKFFSHHKEPCAVYKTTMPTFEKCQDGHGGSADVYITRYIDNGETNLLSHSRTALEALIDMSGYGCDTILQSIDEDKLFIAEI